MGKIDRVQYRAPKIIIGAVSSTNNKKAEFESGLTTLENKKKKIDDRQIHE